MINKILCFLTVLNFLYVPALLAEDVSPDKLFYWSDPRCIDNVAECQKMYHNEIDADLAETNFSRIKWLNPEKIIDMLKIEKGMTILDIGAGTGYFAIPFAKKMEGTGMVFATDIDPINIKNIQKKVQNLGLVNIRSIIVQKDGVDPFYVKNSYDLIFLSFVYYYLRNPVDYFKALRPSLKENGRVCIIQPYNDSDLSLYLNPDSYELFKKILASLLREGPKFPIFNRLSSGLQDYILSWDKGKKEEIPLVKRKEILAELNGMLEDRTLFFAMIDYLIPKQSFSQLEILYKKYPLNASLLVWLANMLNDDRVFDTRDPLSALDKKRLSKLNNILIRYGLNVETFFLKGFGGGGHNYLVAGEEAIVSVMASAGYELLERHTMKPSFILIFGVAD